MIRDLSETLKAVLMQPGLPAELAAAQIVFDRPSEQFNPSVSTVDLFLYDIREDIELRSNEPTIERHNQQATIRRPPLRVACSYLVTAWPGNVTGDELALREHRLLSQTLQVLSRYPKIPSPFLKGGLVGQEPPLPMITAQASELKEPSEFWTAIGNRLRPSLTVTVTIGMEVFLPKTVPTVVTADIRLGERTSPEEEKIKPVTRQEFLQIGGQVTDREGQPVSGATVLLVERGATTTTDAEGRYRFGLIQPGTYTVRVQAGGNVKSVTVPIPAPDGNRYNVQLTT